MRGKQKNVLKSSQNRYYGTWKSMFRQYLVDLVCVCPHIVACYVEFPWRHALTILLQCAP